MKTLILTSLEDVPGRCFSLKRVNSRLREIIRRACRTVSFYTLRKID